MRRCVLISLLVLALASSVPAERVRLDKPVRAVTTKIDGTRVAGQVVAYDGEGFDLLNADKDTIDIAWKELAAREVFRVHASLIQQAPAEAWVDLGALLLPFEDGAAWADRAFARALKIDKSIQPKIDAAREASKPSSEDGELPVADEGDAGMEAAGRMIGKAENQFWGTLDEAHQADAVAQLKRFADETKEKVSPDLSLYETKFFLFYSDLPVAEARRWAGLLDRMYARLSELFGVKRDVNVWRGKGLIFVFREKSDYQRFQRVMHNTDPRWSAGMCHQFGNGMVHIAFYRQADELAFARVLVHESVHGYLHRYRSPARIPSFANEGLADVIASELVPRKGWEHYARFAAREALREHRMDHGFFTDSWAPWKYPVGEALCGFMIQQNKRGYVDFINGIKDGLEWEDSLRTKYGAPVDRLVPAFVQWVNSNP